jgi:hypothetical protein
MVEERRLRAADLRPLRTGPLIRLGKTVDAQSAGAQLQQRPTLSVAGEGRGFSPAALGGELHGPLGR